MKKPECQLVLQKRKDNNLKHADVILPADVNFKERFCHRNFTALPKKYRIEQEVLTFKDTRFVECLPVKDHILTVPLKLDDDVSFSKEFSLVATINHSGSLNACHYWAFIKDNISKSWFKCDDRSILKVKPSTLNNTISYVLF